MIKCSHLTKRFNDKVAVNDVSLNVDTGQIFGLLGPNAAGKTTIIRLLSGLLSADEGDVCINGLPINEAKCDFGYVAQHFGQYEELSVWENVQFYASLYNVKDKNYLMLLLERYELLPYIAYRAGDLSGGYQRRLALVCALAHDPKVLFLDEPTAGIDPVTRKLLWDDFYQLSIEGKTLFVTTHYMEEAQRCHQLAFLSNGKVVAEGSPESIRQALGDVKVYAGNITYRPEIHRALKDLKGVILVNQFGSELRIVVDSSVSESALQAAINAVSEENHIIQCTEPNIEDVFIALTQSNAAHDNSEDKARNI